MSFSWICFSIYCYLKNRCGPYLMRSRRPTAEGCQAGRWISDVGFFRGSGLVPLVGWRRGMVTRFSSPCVLTSINRSATIVLVMVASRRSRAESWLWRPVCKVRASGLSRHVLYLGWTTDRLLLGARLGGPDLNIEGWLARSRGGGVGCRDRLGCGLVLGAWRRRSRSRDSWRGLWFRSGFFSGC